MTTPNPPHRIAFCITDLDPGGAERALVQIVTRLDLARFSPAVFCLSKPGLLVDTLREHGIPVECLAALGHKDVAVVYRLWRALRKFRPQLLQTFLYHANIAGRIAARLAGVSRVVSGIRVAERRSRWPLRIDRLTGPLVDTNVCVSRGVAEFSERVAKLPRRKLEVIPNGVDVEIFQRAEPADLEEFGIPRDSRTLLMVGRLDPQKGLPTLIESLRPLLPRFPDAHLLLVGEGPERGPLERQIAALGLGNRVHLAGWRGDVPQLMRAACGLVLPSLWEGMPNVILEAMAAGLPVVATSVEGSDEVVIDGETGWLVPPGSIEGLSKALEALLMNPNQGLERGKRGLIRVQSLYSWDSVVEAYQDLYSRLLQR